MKTTTLLALVWHHLFGENRGHPYSIIYVLPQVTLHASLPHEKIALPCSWRKS